MALRREDLLGLVTLAALALAVLLRVEVAGVQGAASAVAGLSFGTVLVGIAAGVGLRLPRPTRRDLPVAVLGTLALCAAPALRAGLHTVSWPGFGWWAVVAGFVAVAEELLLRGALFDLLIRAHGPAAAVVVTAVAFGLLHVPVYGVRALPLDLGVGVVLGVLRLIGGTVWAPAVCHTLTDLAGWVLR